MRSSFWLMLCAVVAGSGCNVILPFAGVPGSGVIVAESRIVDDFNAISMNGSANLYVDVGEATSVTVEIDDNLLDLISTDVHNGCLKIRNTQNYRASQRLSIYVTVPDLASINLHGSGDIELNELQSQQLQISINGSGDVVGTGSVGQLTVGINGSGDIDLLDTAASSAVITINGSGDVRLHALEYLSASIHGSGDVRYRGSPVVEQSIAGSGNISPLAE